MKRFYYTLSPDFSGDESITEEYPPAWKLVEQ